MNDRDIGVFLSADNIELLRTALRTMLREGPAGEDAVIRWLDGYLAEHLAAEWRQDRAHAEGEQRCWAIPPVAYDTPGDITPATVAAAGRLGMPPVVLEHVQAVWCEEAARASRARRGEQRAGLCGSRIRVPEDGVVECAVKAGHAGVHRDASGNRLWVDAAEVTDAEAAAYDAERVRLAAEFGLRPDQMRPRGCGQHGEDWG